MSELSGSLILKFPEAVLLSLDEDGSNISDENLSLILASANIDTAGDIREIMGADYTHEGLEKRDGYVLIYPFDEGYMQLMRTLVQEGSGIEIYGGIFHEYGIKEYYVLTKELVRFFGHIDEEGDEDVDSATVRAEFSQLVPQAVKKVFPDVFGG